MQTQKDVAIAPFIAIVFGMLTFLILCGFGFYEFIELMLSLI